MKVTKQKALKIILIFSFAGVIFSGVLSYRELFMSECNLAFVRCGENTGPIAGIPACVLGFLMYMAVFIIAFLGYKSGVSEK